MGFYIFAHRVNAAGPLTTALRYGANALEIDVTRTRSGYWAWHGTDVVDHVSRPLEAHLRDIARRLMRPEGQHVSLLVFDLKYKSHRNREMTAPRINAVRQMVRDLVLTPVNAPETGAGQGGLVALYGMTSDQEDVMRGAIAGDDRLTDHEGINYDAVSYSAKLRATPQRATAWQDRNNVERFMYSAGISARLQRKSARRYSRMARDLKAAGTARRPFLTYSWTFNRAAKAARWANDFDLDGVMGNMGNNFGYLPQHMTHYGLGGRDLVRRSDPSPFAR
ncbi:hypothetical protein [Pseudooctadecabacter sp.]|uniref:hypothetical protein n=1 Tax=Pseudooctadecabacter sp. TaxID=1966338 RepID=UPI003F6C5F3C